MQESQRSFEIRRTFLVHMIAEKHLKALWLECSKTRRGLFWVFCQEGQKNKTKKPHGFRDLHENLLIFGLQADL